MGASVNSIDFQVGQFYRFRTHFGASPIPAECVGVEGDRVRFLWAERVGGKAKSHDETMRFVSVESEGEFVAVATGEGIPNVVATDKSKMPVWWYTIKEARDGQGFRKRLAEKIEGIAVQSGRCEGASVPGVLRKGRERRHRPGHN